jgi:hypothetical protein
MAHKYHNLSKQDKYMILCTYVDEALIKQKLEDNHSFGMIRDWIIRDYPEAIKDERLFWLNTLQTTRSIFKSQGLTSNLKNYNTMPQNWKLQYRFPKDYTLEQIRLINAEKSRKGQMKTVEQRKKNGTLGNPKFKRKDSPLCKEYYTSRGISLYEATKQIKEICSSGGIAACKSFSDNNRLSSIECKIAAILDEIGVSYSQQLQIRIPENNRLFGNLSYIYDFLIGDLIIEVNGTYFHGDNRFFKASDIILGQPAEEVWKKDQHKLDIAKQMGFNVLTLWEYDINYNEEAIKQQIQEILVEQ